MQTFIYVPTAGYGLGISIAIPGRMTVKFIQEATAQTFDVRVDDIKSQCRERWISRPRQVAMSLSRELTHQSLPEIARRFNRLDHTTVLHAIKAVRAHSEKDPEFAAKVETLRDRLAA